MGLSISSLFSLVGWRKDQDVRILILGLDSAGKVRRTLLEDAYHALTRDSIQDDDFVPTASEEICSFWQGVCSPGL